MSIRTPEWNVNTSLSELIINDGCKTKHAVARPQSYDFTCVLESKFERFSHLCFNVLTCYMKSIFQNLWDCSEMNDK